MASQSNNTNTASDDYMAQLVTAPEDIVRAVLIALCQDSKQEQKAIAHFKKIQALRSKQLRPDDNGAAGSMGSTANVAVLEGSNETSNGDSRVNRGKSNKRGAATEIRICDECQEAFTEDDNASDACQYHFGSLEMKDDASIWDEWEDWRDGDQFSKETEEQYPEGFTWDCCNERGDSSGCTRGPHKAQYKKAYRED
ncbi:hypothetical protein F4801DRAFT_189631 [Xylaria longipes]|nr:hypothetical protein F4801DRAFT_189631 [Xylaria longipes]